MGQDMLSWASTMLNWNCTPPINTEEWRQSLLDRVEKGGCDPWIHKWMDHPLRDEYWQHGSICENFEKVTCPLYMIGGWRDCYTNAVFRVLEHVPNSKGMVGPWAHEWPDVALPGPQIDYLNECKRFWDYSLKGVENGIMTKEPRLKVYLRDSMLPTGGTIEHWSGQWVAEEEWPPKDVEDRVVVYSLGENGVLIPRERQEGAANSIDGGGGLRANSIPVLPPAATALDDRTGADGGGDFVEIVGSHYNGMGSGAFLSFGEPDGPADQRYDDALSLTWTSKPLTEDTQVLGTPHVTVDVVVDQPVAYVIARLCDVFPNGSSTLLSRGVLNLTHRNGHSPSEVSFVKPGELLRDVVVKLDSSGWVVKKGNRLRLSLSPSYAPLVWPSPKVVTLKVQLHVSSLTIPVRVPTDVMRKQDAVCMPRHASLKPPSGLKVETKRPGSYRRVAVQDLSSDIMRVEVTADAGSVVIHNTEEKVVGKGEALQVVYDEWSDEVFEMGPDPTSAKAITRRALTIRHKGRPWGVHQRTKSILTCDADNFFMKNHIVVYTYPTSEEMVASPSGKSNRVRWADDPINAGAKEMDSLPPPVDMDCGSAKMPTKMTSLLFSKSYSHVVKRKFV
jgi:predicted acyl esterase